MKLCFKKENKERDEENFIKQRRRIGGQTLIPRVLKFTLYIWVGAEDRAAFVETVLF